jgi:hypothetical protein
MCAWQFVRTASSYTSWAPAIVGFAMWANWKQLAAVFTTDSVFTSAATKLVLDLHKESIRAPIQVQFRAGAFDSGELGRVSAAHLRVAVVMAYSIDVLTVALAAKDRGMLGAGSAWLGLDTVAGAEAFAADGPTSASAAKSALHGWVYFEPSTVAPAAFFDRVREATRAHFPLQPGSGSSPLTPFAANMYDAVMLFALAATSNSSRLSNGVPTLKAMTSVSFDGMTGPVELDENGDMKVSIRAVNYVLERDGAMLGRQIGVMQGPSQRYSPLQNSTVLWPGGVHTMPADFAEAQAAQGFNTSWLLVGAGATALVVISGLVVVVRRRHKRLQAILLMLLTEVGQLVLSLCMSVANLATDAIVYALLLHGDLKVSTEIYTDTYATILCFGVVTTALSLGYRIGNARLVKAQLAELETQGPKRSASSSPGQSASLSGSTTPSRETAAPRVVATGRTLPPQISPLRTLRHIVSSAEQSSPSANNQAPAISEARRLSQQHDWELVQTHRTKVTLMLSLLSLTAQGALAA